MKALGIFSVSSAVCTKSLYIGILEAACGVGSNSTIYILWFCSEMREQLRSLSEDEHNKQ